MDTIRNEIEIIVKDYLYSVASNANHNHFRQTDHNDKATMFKDVGFSMLYEECDNYYVVMEESFLEGCTRVFLINPILKCLMDAHNIKNEWLFNMTFGNFTISNREYESGSFLEFIAELEGKNIGVRYTPLSYSDRELAIMDRDMKYLSGKEGVPGFEKMSPIDSVKVVDWSGLEILETENHFIDNRKITIKNFFEKYFSTEEYEIVISLAKDAVKKAKKIIALQAVPQLLPNNMYSFKRAVMAEFAREKMDAITYEFSDGLSKGALSDNDKSIINKAFYENCFCDSIIGDKDFAKSYITSEYLYKSIKEGLSIDYTSVVVGYLKSVEQLLYILYVSAFDGNSRLEYWDKCNKDYHFDISQPEKYRYDPYASKGDEPKKQELYSHRIRIGRSAPEIGILINFLRYYEKAWSISEDGKEYVIKCLNDYRQYCRNNHFHKDNIDNNSYSTVSMIRNNTQVCLYYLLGAFKLLDKSVEKKEELGIVDYELESLYYNILSRRRFYKARLDDNTEVILYYLNGISDIEFSESGIISGELQFLVLEKDGKSCNTNKKGKLLENNDYLEKYTMLISNDTFPVEMIPVRSKKEWLDELYK